MKKPWIIFFICIAAGMFAISFFTKQTVAPNDTPIRIPTKAEIVKPGLSTYDIIKTSDEARIPELMKPTPIVKFVTQQLMTISCKDGTGLCKLQAIYDFIRTNYEYRINTPEHNYIQSPGETLLQGSGNELDLAILTASMQRAAGFQNEILRSPYHTFVRVKNGNSTLMMDPSCQGCKFLVVSVALRGDEDVFS